MELRLGIHGRCSLICLAVHLRQHVNIFTGLSSPAFYLRPSMKNNHGLPSDFVHRVEVKTWILSSVVQLRP